MFGWINDCTECLVVSKFGEETWHKIKEKANCNVVDGGFLRYKYYPDSDTVSLVVAASEVLGISVDDVLQTFGDYFIDYVQDNGYSNVLECLGNNLRDWLSNLNSLHDHLQASYPKGFVAPVFWSEDDPNSSAEEGAILVYYYSQRGSLLVPLVVGVLKKIARVFFGIEICLEQLTLQDEVIVDPDNKLARSGSPKTHEHTSWRVTAVDPEEAALKLRGKKKSSRRRADIGKDGDDATATTAFSTTSTFMRTKYERTFREGGAQASFLRVEEFVQRAFFKKGCELYHALTLQQYIYLVDFWKTTKLPQSNDSSSPEQDTEDVWCYEVWSIDDDDLSTWPSMKDLPPRLNPATVGEDKVHFGGKVPATGAFPPNDQNALQSFAPIIRVANSLAVAHQSIDLAFSVSKDGDDVMSWSLERAVANATKEAKVLEFDAGTAERMDAGELELLWVVWNDATNEAFHTFNQGDLAATSLQQFFDLVTGANFDPVKLVIQVGESVAVDDDEEDI
jgi:Haem-NO-binding